MLQDAFVDYHERFLDVTHRASRRFLERDWTALQGDATERLGLHKSLVYGVVDAARLVLPDDDLAARSLWIETRRRYVHLVGERMDLELAETFYNSVTRRLFKIVGLDDELEFLWLGPTALPADDGSRGEYRIFPNEESLSECVREVFEHSPLGAHFADLEADAERVAGRVAAHLDEIWDGQLDAIEVLRPIFYRNKGAYLVGRLRWLNRVSPIVIPLLNTERGVHVDAALLTETDASRLFGYTRSYFHVLCRRPAAVVGFLKSLLPVKPVAELYTSIGYSQHGKTNLFRALYRHMDHSNTRFERARGARGMVMAVFTLPSFDVVFKLIKDRFAPTKRTTPEDVKRRYKLVFNHDRVGRLVDAQEFTNLSFQRDRFDEDLIDELRSFAANTDTGDRAELPELDDRTWRLVSVSRDECPGARRCPVGDDCLAERARRKAATADIIVVNLHLYAIEVMIEGILPAHDLVVIDEAHQLEDIMSEAAGRQVSPARLQAAARATGAVVAERDAPVAVEEAATLLQALLEPMVGERLTEGFDDDAGVSIDLIRGRVERLLNALRAVPEDAPADTAAKALRARQAVTSLLDDIDYVRWPVDDDVLWVDGPPHNPSLRSTPVAIDELLHENLWAKRAGVLTSATMSATASARLGLPAATPILDVGSPFDFENNALLYCPTDLPDPRSAESRDARLAELEALIVAAGGRTLALFTSWAAMRDAAAHLEPRLPWPVLVQGEGSKMALLESFTNHNESCLFATMSFWQGVDVPGSTCNLVVIDRLPFPRPDNPVLQARRERAGSAAFRTIDLPRAATLLAQGAGRLIRSSTDRGVVAILDPRLATSRNYRWDLINALPPMRRTKDRSEVETLLRDLRDGD